MELFALKKHLYKSRLCDQLAWEQSAIFSLTNIRIFISRTQMNRHMRTVFMKAEHFNIKTFLNCASVDVKSNFIHLNWPCFLMHTPHWESTLSTPDIQLVENTHTYLFFLLQKYSNFFMFYKINYDSFSFEILLNFTDIISVSGELFLQSGF